jgi:predicted GH43/DUF377 family glycosyl hydrolase
MHWEKLGLVYSPNKKYNWTYSHCQLPVADMEGDLCKVYFASRTVDQVSHIGWVKFNINDPEKIIEESSQPVVSPGAIGHFDQWGVYPSSIITVNGHKYLYYIGWIRGVERPLFYASIGLAISEDGGGNFIKYATVPVMDTSIYDPCLVTSPNVIVEEGVFRMTYVSGTKWERDQKGDLISFYNIKCATSEDGIIWKREGITAVDFKVREKNIARSSVLKEDGLYKMWFSYVHPDHNKYRIGYAESADFKNWQRFDENAGIDVSANSFDSEMICYPNVFIYKREKYMVYNGNNFGERGFGLAIAR